MAVEIRLKIADVTAPQPTEHQFTLRREGLQVELLFDNKRALLGTQEWAQFVQQVSEREPNRWAYPRATIPEPLGRPDLRAIAASLRTTPIYQLFLAGVDIASAVGLPSAADEDRIVETFERLEGTLRSCTGSGGIFLLPGRLLEGHEEAPDELIRSGKLGEVALFIDGEEKGVKYYIPYAVPISSSTPIGRDTEQVWDNIRTFYYAFRY